MDLVPPPKEEGMPRPIRFTLNGQPASVEADDGALLLDVLRNGLGLTGSRFGCGLAQCGACAVLVDSEVKPACATDMGAVEGRTVLTVEGLGTPERPHPLQQAFLDLQAGQCGYCLSGIIMRAKALLDHNPSPTRADIMRALDKNLCRCGAHPRILRAVEKAAAMLREGNGA